MHISEHIGTAFISHIFTEGFLSQKKEDKYNHDTGGIVQPMKPRFLLVSFLAVLLILFVAGCRRDASNKSGQAAMPSTETILQKPVTTPESFQDLYQQWTPRLETIAGKTESAYNDLNDKKINQGEFNNQIDPVYKEMKALNLETDSKADFKLSVNDQQKVDYEAITRAYQQASKGLNDFLYHAPHLSGDALKAKHDELITNKYQPNVVALKKLLNI